MGACGDWGPRGKPLARSLTAAGQRRAAAGAAAMRASLALPLWLVGPAPSRRRSAGHRPGAAAFAGVNDSAPPAEPEPGLGWGRGAGRSTAPGMLRLPSQRLHPARMEREGSPRAGPAANLSRGGRERRGGGGGGGGGGRSGKGERERIAEPSLAAAPRPAARTGPPSVLIPQRLPNEETPVEV